MKFFQKFIPLACIAVYLFACTVEVHTIAARPETVVDTRTAPPFPGAVWIEPEYRWDGRTYIIEPGHWARPVRTGIWMHGHWKETRGGYTWVPGYWQ